MGYKELPVSRRYPALYAIAWFATAQEWVRYSASLMICLIEIFPLTPYLPP